MEGEKTSIDDKLINEFNNIYFDSGKRIEKVDICKKNNLFNLNLDCIEKNEENSESKEKENIYTDNRKISEEKESICNPSKRENEEKSELLNKSTKQNENLNNNLLQINKNNNSEVIQDEEKIDTFFVSFLLIFAFVVAAAAKQIVKRLPRI